MVGPHRGCGHGGNQQQVQGEEAAGSGGVGAMRRRPKPEGDAVWQGLACPCGVVCDLIVREGEEPPLLCSGGGPPTVPVPARGSAGAGVADTPGSPAAPRGDDAA